MKKLGVELPANAQFTQSQFLDLVKKAKAAGMTPIAQGVGDRPFPGAYILGEALLRKLGKEDYRKLWTGKLSFDGSARRRRLQMDEGARRCRCLSEELHDPQARRIALLFLYQARRADAADGQLVHGTRLRAGGQGRPAAKDFPLGVMQFPAMDGGACNQCKTSAVGASFAINSASKHKEVAAEFINAMSTPEMGKRWIETVYLQTGIKADVKSFSGPHAAYFTELMERQKGEDYFIGGPRDLMRGNARTALRR